MIRLLFLVLPVSIVSALCPLSAYAETLNPDKIERFIQSMDDVQVMAESMKAEGKTDILKDKVGLPAEGQTFEPYTIAIKALKSEFPSDYKKLGDIIKKNGFSSQQEWASTGDTVAQAYMASSVSPEMIEGLSAMKAQMSPAMMAQMPPAMAAKMKYGLRMMETLKNVPQENQNAIGPYKDQLDKLVSNNAHYAE